MRIFHILGTRPNFIKATPVIAAFREYTNIDQIVIHTGQHFDVNMSEVFFKQLGMSRPDLNLDVEPSNRATQIVQIMSRLKPLLLKRQPDLVFVYGDVNSTLAASLACAKLRIPLAHIEAGLRSFDRTMPEEVNRLLTDKVSDLLFTHCKDADDNLKLEGIPPAKIHFVGNVMIDTLVQFFPQSQAYWEMSGKKFGVDKYVLVTLHRPSNVDYPEILSKIVATLIELSREIPVIFPVHPRTRRRINEHQLSVSSKDRFILLAPLGYIEFLAMESHATIVITDSGGIQEETTFLNIPCLTLRENTERPITITLGTNILMGHDMKRLIREVRSILNNGTKKQRVIPPLWDGHAAKRIAKVVVQRR